MLRARSCRGQHTTRRNTSQHVVHVTRSLLAMQVHWSCGDLALGPRIRTCRTTPGVCAYIPFAVTQQWCATNWQQVLDLDDLAAVVAALREPVARGGLLVKDRRCAPPFSPLVFFPPLQFEFCLLPSAVCLLCKRIRHAPSTVYRLPSNIYRCRVCAIAYGALLYIEVYQTRCALVVASIPAQ